MHQIKVTEAIMIINEGFLVHWQVGLLQNLTNKNRGKNDKILYKKNSQCHFLRSNYDLKYYSHIIIIRHLSQASGFGKEKNK